MYASNQRRLRKQWLFTRERISASLALPPSPSSERTVSVHSTTSSVHSSLTSAPFGEGQGVPTRFSTPHTRSITQILPMHSYLIRRGMSGGQKEFPTFDCVVRRSLHIFGRKVAGGKRVLSAGKRRALYFIFTGNE